MIDTDSPTPPAPTSAPAGASELVTLDEIRAAAERIRPIARVTPLLDVPWPLFATDAVERESSHRRLWLKCENLQPMGAFKIRGAANMLASLTPTQLSRGVITYSSGNHGQAVALAARERGVPAVIVMPTTAPAVKVEGARTYGAEVVFAGTTSLDRKAKAEAIAAERGLTMVPPFDHRWILAGQGTVALEILEQAPGVDVIVVPVGGGGLLGGIAATVKQSGAHTRVIGVEPSGAPKMSRSLAAGAPATLERTTSIADGLLALRPGDIPFAHARAFVDHLVTVDDDRIAAAVGWIARHARMVVEPSGAITVAAVAAGLIDAPPDARIVAVVSGGNIEPAQLASYLAG